jgi:type I restriction enzyme M protein
MKNFASESGKSKGQFYTPAEVSRVMAKVIDISEAATASQTLYDIITTKTIQFNYLILKAY